MFKKFIQKPVLSTVISVIIVILGILGLVSLPITQYPDIAPPTVSVSASYSGANAETVLNSVIAPLEEQINGVEGMQYMTSTATSDGAATITVYFKLGTDPDMAAVNVQNRVSRASSVLPAEVTKAGVITSKKQSSNLLIFSLYSENPAYDQTFLQNYASINLIPVIKRINGVGDAAAFGSRDYTMRIWLKPDVMATYGLIPDDINMALAEQNIEAAPGSLGENASQSFQYSLKYKGRLKSESEFSDIIVRTTSDGQLLRLKDIARIELGSQSYASNTITDGHPAIGISVSQTAGSNAREIVQHALQQIDESAVNFPKGVKYATLLNVNSFLDASIEKVIETLIEAFVLVFIVVFVFLQDWRSTLIPAISVPVAIVGTFFFLYLFGFTINLLTLFALVLAVGIVVDDAIVVVEAVHAKLDEGEKSSKRASVLAMNEISGAIISITLVMAAVFVPVSFIGGSTGVFYKQFGLTLAIAIVLSAVNALTLSPALCAIFLKSHSKGAPKKMNLLNRFYAAFNTAFDATTSKYKNAVTGFSKKAWTGIAAVAVFSVALIWLMSTTSKGFVPNEDQGVIMCDISLPPGTSLERSEQVAADAEKIFRAIPEVEHILKISGQGLLSGVGSNNGMIILKLKDWHERKGRGQSVDAIIGQLYGRISQIKDASILIFSPPTLTGFGMSNGFEFQLQNKGSGSIDEFYSVSTKFLAALNKRPEIQRASTSFNPNYPQYRVDIDIARARKAGFTGNEILNILQGYYGGVYASNFNSFGKQYRVMYQSDTLYRADPNTLNLIKVRNADGVMAPLSEFVSLEKVAGPSSLSRFNLFTAIAVNGSPNVGYSSGQAIKAIQEVAASSLPSGYGFEFSGQTREEQSSSSQTVYIFLLCLVFVYFLLAAQYESYILPFAVILSLPVGLAGTFIFARIFGVENNIYLQITLIMLIGLLAKNAILIVEYAVERRRHGMGLLDAAVSGAAARLRPILMTSFAFISGLMPLMLAAGVGANGNRSIGTGAVGGMLIGTLFGLFVIPVLFVIFQGLHERFFGPLKSDADWENEIRATA